ncbi:MAG: fumarylacetoacetase [Deltaproteobacteria bacterium]|nr:fumarylacetoacetase [Deltaproteobacteria bacterium]
MRNINETHDPALKSWVASAQGSDFPIQNLPYAVFQRPATSSEAHIGVAIGDRILDLHAAVHHGLLSEQSPALRAALQLSTLNGLMSLGSTQWSKLRRALSDLLREGSALGSNLELQSQILLPMLDATFLMPADVRNYTDFYASVHHATRVGSLFRPDNPLFPNYKYVPIAYHGRASSVVVSGRQVLRPHGQCKSNENDPPEYRPSKSIDFELELGTFIGMGNALGTTISIDRAEEHLFGFCLLNDWSARDIQKWEYQPLGPFLAKNFLTSISPWVVTNEALAPFRCAPAQRDSQDPPLLPYLSGAQDQSTGAFDVTLEVTISSAKMREKQLPPQRIVESNSKYLYWTPAQCITHHASNGCNLLPGDLLGSGTISGPHPGARGCLLELTEGGKVPLQLPSGETRKFLEDGDEICLAARAVRQGAVSIGFGQVLGEVVPASR